MWRTTEMTHAAKSRRVSSTISWRRQWRWRSCWRGWRKGWCWSAYWWFVECSAHEEGAACWWRMNGHCPLHRSFWLESRSMSDCRWSTFGPSSLSCQNYYTLVLLATILQCLSLHTEHHKDLPSSGVHTLLPKDVFRSNKFHIAKCKLLMPWHNPLGFYKQTLQRFFFKHCLKYCCECICNNLISSISPNEDLYPAWPLWFLHRHCKYFLCKQCGYIAVEAYVSIWEVWHRQMQT